MQSGMERRQFLKVLGVSGAGGAVLSGCSSSPEKLIPYVTQQQEIVPGVATWYRTTCRECPAGCGMNVRTREGRAVKVEGNPLSPISHGHLCARGQASLHGLYDPDRVPQALARKQGGGWDKIEWTEAENRLRAALQQHRGRTVFLTHTFTGALDRLIDDWSAAMGVRRLRYDTFGWEPIRAANRALFGIDAVPVHDFSNADYVITFGADFMETWVSPVDYQHGFTLAHSYTAAKGQKGQLVSVGPHQSLTDMNADEWLNVLPGTEHLVALAMARVIVDAGASAGGAAALLQTVDVNQVAQQAGVSPDRLRAVARAFANNGRSLAVGPGVRSQTQAATALAAAVAILNSVAGNIGRTVRFEQQEAFTNALGTYADLQALIAQIRAGQVTALLVYGPNPVFTMPEGEAVKEVLGAIPFLASFSSMNDETSDLAHLLLPDNHALESWGDYAPRTGVRSIIQPVMQPVFSTKQTADVLLSVAHAAGAAIPNATAVTVPPATGAAAGAAAAAAPAQTRAPTFYEYLRATWAREVLPQAGFTGTADDQWAQALQAGGVVNTTATAQGAAPAINPAGLGQLRFDVPTFAGEGDFTLLIYPSLRFYDGRLANRMWMQELPDPVSKFTWESWVEISPAVAERMSLDTGHTVRVRTATGQSEPVMVWVHPGMRDDVIAIQLGQGHETLGRFSRDRGLNPVRLIRPESEPASGALAYVQTKARIEPTGDWVRPPQHGINDDQENREIARAIPVNEARQADLQRAQAAEGHQEPAHGEEAGGHHGEAHPLDAKVEQLQAVGGMAPIELDASPKGFPQVGMFYGEYHEAAPRWGMAIDLERCTGCSACVTACYAENNIAVVGPDQVAMGRIMHWIRIERYFERDQEGELHQTHFLPMLCQHCGNAPCEPVCPVYAAYHTPDGLNAQVYNRCVGTRYCANNCPYKVRVFNWFTAEWPEPLNWQLNPDVTVREKGVMEKCTFCVQRIRDAQNHARVEDRAIADGEVVPACAQTCPSDAIVFGNLRDPNARVTKVAASGRGYRVLEMINTQSAITYLKKVVEEAEV